MTHNLKTYPKPTAFHVGKLTCAALRSPKELVSLYSDEEFEDFVKEWVRTLPKSDDVYAFGGAGDKGRDVVAYNKLTNEWRYYQCKHYDHPIMPSEIWVEFGKLVYHTFKQSYPVPKEYFIIAPQDTGAGLTDLVLHRHTTLGSDLIKEWPGKCYGRIERNQDTLTAELETYIKSFNFSIIKLKPIDQVIDEHRTALPQVYGLRFGEGLVNTRPQKIIVPKAINGEEHQPYLKKVIDAILDFGRKNGLSIKTFEDIVNDDEFKSEYERQRERFFYAESLRTFAEDSLMLDEYFNSLKDDVYYSIIDIVNSTFLDGRSRLQAVMSQIAGLTLAESNILVKYGIVRPPDKQGICHHLANERDDIKWVK